MTAVSWPLALWTPQIPMRGADREGGGGGRAGGWSAGETSEGDAAQAVRNAHPIPHDDTGAYV